jgi:RNase P subunit RPR2
VKRKESRKDAARITETLIERASVTALQDPELAKEQATLARTIALKFNLRFDWQLKRFFCHGCKRLIIPGLNARVRLEDASDHVSRLWAGEQEKTEGTLKYGAARAEKFTPCR